MYGRPYHSAHTPATFPQSLVICSPGRLDTVDTASLLGTGGWGRQEGPGNPHGNSHHSNSTSTSCRHHHRSNNVYTATSLQPNVLYTVGVFQPSSVALRLLLHRESGSSAHSLLCSTAGKLQVVGSKRTPVCFLNQWLCPRRATTDLRHNKPPLTRLHTAGEHSTDLWGQTAIGC